MCNDSLFNLHNHYTFVMIEGRTSKSVLSKPNSVGIMIHLLESNGTSKMTFIQAAMGGNYDTVKNAVKRLEDEGLLTQKEIPGKSKYILVELTDLGYLVAEDLKRANDRILAHASDHESSVIDSQTSAPADALASKRTESAARGGEEDLLNDDCAKKSVTGGGG